MAKAAASSLTELLMLSPTPSETLPEGAVEVLGKMHLAMMAFTHQQNNQALTGIAVTSRSMSVLLLTGIAVASIHFVAQNAQGSDQDEQWDVDLDALDDRNSSSIKKHVMLSGVM
jgi:uncharacterized membrane protein